MIHDTWTGPTYLSGLAGELHAPVIWVSLLCAAAWIGAVGQLVGAWAYERVPSYKHYTLRLALASRALWLLPLFMAGFWWHRQHSYREPFPVERWCALTAVVACGAALFGASSAAAWNSWMRALVPVTFRGRFFGERQRFVMFALIGANLIAATCVDWRPGGFLAGFALLGMFSVTGAGISTWLLSRVEDAGTPTRGGPASLREFAAWVRGPLRDPGFRGALIYGAAFNGVMQLAGPYFPYYFTRELGFPMSRIAYWTVLTSLGSLIAAARWGGYLDRSGIHPRGVMRAMGSLVALSPLLYVTSSVAWVRFIAPWDYFTNGIFWMGYLLAQTTLLYRAIPLSASPALCFSIYSAAAGLCGAIGSFAGGRLAELLAPWGGFRMLFLASSLLRFAVIIGLFGWVRVPESADHRGTEGRPQPLGDADLAEVR